MDRHCSTRYLNKADSEAQEFHRQFMPSSCLLALVT